MNIDKVVKSRFWFRMFLLRKLPLAWVAGIQIQHIDNQSAIVSLPFSRFNLNPFKSMYFASMTMASELSTGVLVLNKIAAKKAKISMLVIDMKGEFLQRGLEKLVFECPDGELINSAIEATMKTGEGQTMTLSSKGYNQKRELISQFEYTWSIKVKQTQ